MSEFLDALRRAKESGDFSPLVGRIPYASFMGLGLELRDEGLVGTLRYSDRNVGNPTLPALHGGAVGGLLEFTATFHTLWESETLVFPKIVTITVDYLRSARPVDTFAKGTITKPGRRVVNVGVEAWQEDRARPVARANAHFLIEPIGG